MTRMEGPCVEKACGRIKALTRPDTDNPNAMPSVGTALAMVAKIHRI